MIKLRNARETAKRFGKKLTVCVANTKENQYVLCNQCCTPPPNAASPHVIFFCAATASFVPLRQSQCDVVYKQGLRWFGVKEVGARTESVNKSGDRRASKIFTLVCERRELRRRLRRAQTDLERNGLLALIKVTSERL